LKSFTLRFNNDDLKTKIYLRLSGLTFITGSGLGYFLELWGTTRACWTYYTYQTPPLFAVLAHGMAALAFWRAVLLIKMMARKVGRFKIRRLYVEE